MDLDQIREFKILEKVLKREIKDQGLIDLYWKRVKVGYVEHNGKEKKVYHKDQQY